MARAKTPGVDSARRVLEVLLLFSEDEPTMSVDDLVQRTGVSQPTMYRYLALLRELALVEEHSYGRYALSPLCLAMGKAAERAYPQSEEVGTALAALASATGETAQLMRRIDDSAVCSALSETPQAVRLSFTLGHAMPLHRGAAAKVLLAGMGQDWARRYLARCDPPLTENEQRERLAELARIRGQGWAESSAEVDEGIWAHAAAVRQGGRMIAAVTVAGPRYRLDEAAVRQIRHEVDATAQALSG